MKNVKEDIGGREEVPKEEEEGSADLQTPDKAYTPGYDYIGGEEEREDNIIPTRTPSSVRTTARTSLRTSPAHANIHTTKPVTKTHQTTVTPALRSSSFKWESSLTSTYNPNLHSTAPHVTGEREREAVQTVKILRQSSNTTRHLNRDLKQPKAFKQRVVNSTGGYGNLNVPDPIRRSAFWEVGNWSDVRMHMSSFIRS